MVDRPTQRRLAAILAADVAGYSRLMHEDEAATIAAWHSARSDAIDPQVAAFGGRIVKHTGDGFLAEFSTATDAVECAIRIQDDLRQRNRDQPPNRRMEFRMGINLGEITVDDEDIHGDGVNIAARLESLAEAGGICVSAVVHDQVRRKVNRVFENLGHKKVKNIAEPVSCYRVLLEDGVDAEGASRRDGGAPVRRRRLIVWSGLALLFILFGVAAWQATTPSGPAGPPSLAVVPFRSLDGNPQQKAFSDGLTQDVITALLTSSSIRVIAGQAGVSGQAGSSAARTAGPKANYIFEGSVRGGAKIRVTAQLVETGTGLILWGGQYDRTLSDSLAQQAEVSAKIVATLADKLDRIQRQQRLNAQGPGASDIAMGALKFIGLVTNEAVALPGRLLDALAGNTQE